MMYPTQQSACLRNLTPGSIRGRRTVTAMRYSEELNESKSHLNPTERIAIPKSAFKRLEAAEHTGESTIVHREL